jgi:tRNA(fMet)-specific endonuclease VapC
LVTVLLGLPNVVERLRNVDEAEVGITIITKAKVLCGRIDYIIKAETSVDSLKAQELLFRTEELLNRGRKSTWRKFYVRLV